MIDFNGFKEKKLEKIQETVDVDMGQEYLSSKTLNESDLNMLKIYSSNSSEISIPSLVDLVLLNIKGKVVNENNRDELLMFKMINEDGLVTNTGKMYLESIETKDRLKKILK